MVLDGPAPGGESPEDPPPPRLTPEHLFHAHLKDIEALIRLVARLNGLTPEERDEFAGEVRLHLIEDDYAILRQFKGNAKLTTYLTTVIQRQYLDYRNKVWGKWRPSAVARRLGPIATRLDRLTTRDGLSFDEAVNVLQTNEGVTLSREELLAIFQQLPKRKPKRFVSDEVLEDAPSPVPTSEEAMLARERSDASEQAKAALERALRTLEPQDRLIVKLAYNDHMTLATISRLMDLEQKPLYRRLKKIEARLRTALEAEGISGSDLGGFGNDPEEPDA